MRAPRLEIVDDDRVLEGGVDLRLLLLELELAEVDLRVLRRDGGLAELAGHLALDDRLLIVRVFVLERLLHLVLQRRQQTQVLGLALRLALQRLLDVELTASSSSDAAISATSPRGLSSPSGRR